MKSTLMPSMPNKLPLRLSLGIAASLGLALAPFLSGNGADARKTPVPTVSVDMPHGGCRLSIWKDGQASISYGSMPKWVSVTPGTFDFDQVIGLLRSRSYPQDDRPFDSQSTGTVALPGSEGLRRIDYVGLVRSLLEKAWKARIAPRRDWPAEDHDWVAKVCAFTE
jgi:hypothetical protein